MPDVLSEAMIISWTQNVVILEADLSLQEKIWYIQAIQKFNWSKLVLIEKIKSGIHAEMYHAEENHIRNERPGTNSIAGEPVYIATATAITKKIGTPGCWQKKSDQDRFDLLVGMDKTALRGICGDFNRKTHLLIKASIACGRQLTLCYTNMITRSERT